MELDFILILKTQHKVGELELEISFVKQKSVMLNTILH